MSCCSNEQRRGEERREEERRGREKSLSLPVMTCLFLSSLRILIVSVAALTLHLLWWLATFTHSCGQILICRQSQGNNYGILHILFHSLLFFSSSLLTLFLGINEPMDRCCECATLCLSLWSVAFLLFSLALSLSHIHTDTFLAPLVHFYFTSDCLCRVS